jgi:hypothetical protein
VKPKFYLSKIPAGRKTNRIRGAILGFIREFIRARHIITWESISPPLAHRQALHALNLLKKNGELKITKAGKRGRIDSRPTVYSTTDIPAAR